MAFSTILGLTLSNNNAAARLENKKETLKAIAAVLDGITCIALAALAITSSMGGLGNISPGMTGVMAGASLGIGFLVLKSIINLAIKKISAKKLWGDDKTEKVLVVTNFFLIAIGAIAFASLYLGAFSIVARAKGLTTVFSGLGVTAGGVVLGAGLLNFIIKQIISSACNKSKATFSGTTLEDQGETGETGETDVLLEA